VARRPPGEQQLHDRLVVRFFFADVALPAVFLRTFFLGLPRGGGSASCSSSSTEPGRRPRTETKSAGVTPNRSAQISRLAMLAFRFPASHSLRNRLAPRPSTARSMDRPARWRLVRMLRPTSSRNSVGFTPEP
jgi:hypothetical protein